jgi:hypothetical protein
MAKMFYTMDEVCQKLAKTEDEIKQMVRSGQIQEFRDRDKLMFKVEQIDLLAGGDDDSGEVHLELEDTSGGSGLDLAQDSSLGLADSREGPGISVFDTGHGEAAARAAGDTHVGGETVEEELSLESVGSGSGLLDLTRESDDTSLGAELLEEVYSSEDNIEMPAHASGLFEAAGAESPGDAIAGGGGVAVPVMIETYDGTWSGAGAGLLIGALAALICVALMCVVGIMGATPDLAMRFAGNIWMWAGGLALITIILGLVGLFIGKASE